ncbi:hypothetical protein Tco_0551279 [Tanacetum coccineum]
MLAQVSNQRNVGNQNGNVVNENVSENDLMVSGNEYSLNDKNEAKTDKTEHENGKSCILGILVFDLVLLPHSIGVYGCILGLNLLIRVVGTWYYSLGVSSIVDAFVRSELWEASCIVGRIEKVSSLKCAIDYLELSGLINSYVMSPMENDRGVTEGREDVREVFQQCRSRAKRKLSKCGRNQMGNEPILAFPEGPDDFVVYYDARESKDLEAGLEKREGDCEDIQCAGSDTRPPMLDKADFASWQQRIRLYCRGKENGVNILKSIDEGPFQMGTTRAIVAEGTEGTLNLGPERPRVYSDLSQDEKDRYNADIWATNIILQGLPKDIYSLINHYTDTKDIWDNVKMLLEGSDQHNGKGGL